MRITPLVLLAVAGCGPASSSTAPPVTAPSGAAPVAAEVKSAANGQAIPQDRARIEQRRREKREWYRRSIVEAYDRVGKKDPRWDAAAREALEAGVRYFTREVDPVANPRSVQGLTKKAIEAGCDDPMVLYVHARSTTPAVGVDAAEIRRRHDRAAAAMEKSTYPPVRRAIALLVAAEKKAPLAANDPRARQEAERLLDAALALLPRIVAEDKPTSGPDHDWYGIPVRAFDLLLTMNSDSTAAFERVDAAMATLPELKAQRLKMKGRSLIERAWEARGNGFAGTVTEAGWKTMREALTEARRVLSEAWELDQADSNTARLQITVNMGLDGDRADMERWFTRAMEANGDDRDACEAKMDWLDPKWHGSREDLIAFGRACRDTENWTSGIPLLVADAYFRWVDKADDNERLAFVNTKELSGDIPRVYDAYLERYPYDTAERTNFAVYCTTWGQYRAADQLFQMLGTGPLPGTGKFKEKYIKEIRDIVAEELNAARKSGT
jgi:hypothetical protein